MLCGGGGCGDVEVMDWLRSGYSTLLYSTLGREGMAGVWRVQQRSG